MRSFCLRVAGFLLLQAVLFLGLVWDPAYPREDGFLAATIDKHHRLERTPSPRVLLVGGSNVAFGLRAGVLEEELGVPVVNMGLVAGLGPGFLLNEVAGALRPGDMVVISFEDSMLGGTDNLLHQRQLLEYRPASWRFCPEEARGRLLLDHGLSLAGGIVRRSLGFPRLDIEGRTEFPYVRHGYDDRGDYVLHHGHGFRLDQVPADSVLLEPTRVPVFSPRLRWRLEAFVRESRAGGARVCWTFPPRPEGHYPIQRPALEAAEAELRSIRGLEVLDRAADHAYGLRLFADTVNHLTEEGGRLRTLKVAASLKGAGAPPESTLRARAP